MELVIGASKVWLHSQPSETEQTRIQELPRGTSVSAVAAPDGGWRRVRVSGEGQPKEGFVATDCLVSAEPPDVPATATGLEVHLEGKGQRAVARGRRYPLNEAGQPRRESPATRTSATLDEIIDWLDVENSARYEKKGKLTYCNVYAYDYCYLAGAYIPRVFWERKKFLQRAIAGETLPIVYDTTVQEQSANSLHDLLVAYGETFGWQAELDLSTAQKAANDGSLVLITAKTKDLTESGHVAVVAAEGDDFTAVRDETGEVTKPVTSQAGGENRRRIVRSDRWWIGSDMSTWSAWIHP